MELVFNGILDSDDLVFFVADLVEGGVKRGGLTRASRPGHQYHTIGFSNVAPKFSEILFGKAHHIQVQIAKFLVNLLFVENTNDRVLAMNGGHDGHAEVHVAALIPDSKAAVLRHAALGDIEFGHYLDTRNQRLVISEVDGIDFGVQRPVNAVFDLHLSIAGLDVDV